MLKHQLQERILLFLFREGHKNKLIFFSSSHIFMAVSICNSKDLSHLLTR